MASNTYPMKLTEQSWVFGNHYFNLCCVQGKTASILIEVGVSAVVDTAIGQMENLGLTPDYLGVTHPHPDHLTGLDGLRSRYPDATPIAGSGAVDFFIHPKAVQSMVFEDRHMTHRLDEWGWKSVRPPLKSPLVNSGFQVVADGDRLDLGEVTVQFIGTCGHAPGSIAAWVPEREILVASDALGFRYSDGTFLPLFFTGFEDYLHTLKRLESYRPQVLCLGHQGPLTGQAAGEAFRSARMAAVDLRERIQSHPGSDGELADDLFSKIYRDELRLYSKENIQTCVRLLIQRSRS